eukprot:CAMPEP_0169147442 /NCGR_PEP_ID=MMETSP1015-20121227/48224_1 /TAXON_ID=342587 /ORGANISM="Karlodinium micrum, Strain CCMP2283" /LENGTH=124 /DNA_ID=CAMNT_0009215653 /DNA_START=199 /DNA_END=570 /DNA_ORIENTATION=-
MTFGATVERIGANCRKDDKSPLTEMRRLASKVSGEIRLDARSSTSWKEFASNRVCAEEPIAASTPSWTSPNISDGVSDDGPNLKVQDCCGCGAFLGPRITNTTTCWQDHCLTVPFSLEGDKASR